MARYQIQRGLFNTLCGFIILVALFRSCVPPSRTVPAATVIVSPNYRLTRCSLRDTKVYDFHAKNPEQITVNLREGGYCDRYILPLAWEHYFTQKSQGPGDYATVWCNGHPAPGPIRPDSVAYLADASTYSQGGDFQNCHQAGENTDDFFAQGKGTILLTRTSVHPEYAAIAQDGQSQPVEAGTTGTLSAPTPAAENANKKEYKLTEMEPLGGNHDDYTFLLKQCYREGERIKCWGLMTNTTDAPRYTNLHDSKAVDDEGNSIFVGTFGGEFMFPGSGSMYGTQENLIQGVPTKFIVTIGDPHRNVKTINLELHVNGGSPYRYDTLVFKDVPVQ